MKNNLKGTLRAADAVLITRQLTSGTTPISSDIPDYMGDYDGFSLVLVTENVERTIVVTGTDNVVASTKTFTFTNGGFTSNDVGASLTLAGCTNAGNNHTFTISSVTNATTVVCSTATGLTNETFDPTAVTAVVVDAPVTGAWTIHAADDYFELDGINFVDAGHFADISALASPALVAVSAASVQGTQIVPCMFGTVVVTFTPSGGKPGYVSAYRVKKGNS